MKRKTYHIYGSYNNILVDRKPVFAYSKKQAKLKVAFSLGLIGSEIRNFMKSSRIQAFLIKG